MPQMAGRNGDPRATDPIDWIEQIPFGETRNYVQRVLENTEVYRARLAGKDVPLRISRTYTRRSAAASVLAGKELAKVFQPLAGKLLRFRDLAGAHSRRSWLRQLLAASTPRTARQVEPFVSRDHVDADPLSGRISKPRL
jgi:hypothetical protein